MKFDGVRLLKNDFATQCKDEVRKSFMEATLWVDESILYEGGVYLKLKSPNLLIAIERIRLPFSRRSKFSCVSIPKDKMFICDKQRTWKHPTDFGVITRSRNVMLGICDVEVRKTILRWMRD